MGKVISFTTPGALDIQSATTFGVTTKTGDDSAIGYFGTGLKYAIAICLRLNQNVVVGVYKHGDLVERYAFTTITENIGGKDFSVVHVNGQRCAFTTEVGKTWTLMDAYRELYSNTVDAKGVISEDEVEAGVKLQRAIPVLMGMYSDNEYVTVITVSGEAFVNSHRNRKEFLLTRNLIGTWNNVEVHEGQTTNIYYKGIKVFSSQVPFLYTYNLMGKVELTEDRTAKNEYSLRAEIAECISSSDNKDVISHVVTASDKVHESKLYFFNHGAISEEFKLVVSTHARKFTKNLSETAYNVCKMDVLAELSASGCSATPEEAEYLKKAVDLCHKIGYPVDINLVFVADNLGKDCLGMTNGEHIFITRSTFDQGMRMLVGTLIEEHIHLTLGLQDCTRELQNHLLNVMVSKSLWLIGEPY